MKPVVWSPESGVILARDLTAAEKDKLCWDIQAVWTGSGKPNATTPVAKGMGPFGQSGVKPSGTIERPPLEWSQGNFDVRFNVDATLGDRIERLEGRWAGVLAFVVPAMAIAIAVLACLVWAQQR